jgi:hypothetical protein
MGNDLKAASRPQVRSEEMNNDMNIASEYVCFGQSISEKYTAPQLNRGQMRAYGQPSGSSPSSVKGSLSTPIKANLLIRIHLRKSSRRARESAILSSAVAVFIFAALLCFLLSSHAGPCASHASRKATHRPCGVLRSLESFFIVLFNLHGFFLSSLCFAQ